MKRDAFEEGIELRQDGRPLRPRAPLMAKIGLVLVPLSAIAIVIVAWIYYEVLGVPFVNIVGGALSLVLLFLLLVIGLFVGLFGTWRLASFARDTLFFGDAQLRVALFAALLFIVIAILLSRTLRDYIRSRERGN